MEGWNLLLQFIGRNILIKFYFGILYLGGKYGMYSAPTWVAFLYGIPFAIGILVCVIVAVVIKKKTVK